MDEELWIDIKNYESLYRISNWGNVKSLDKLDLIGRPVMGRMLTKKLSSAGVNLDTRADGAIEFRIKQIDLESIVINMITNAFEQVKGTDKRLIRITIEQNDDYIFMFFEDTGSGVPNDKRDLIFLPFETTKDDGIGLGLCIVKDIVQNYNGEISVESSEELGGAKFRVIFKKEGEQL